MNNHIYPGAEWLGEVPKHWDFYKGKYIFGESNDKGNEINLELLSPTQKYGVIPQTLYEQYTTLRTVKVKEDTDLTTFKTVHKGNFCISLRSFQGGFEYSEYEGVVSPAYHILYSKRPIYDGFYKYLFKEQSFIAEMNSYCQTLRDGKNISYSDFGKTLIPYPPMEEQQVIADYLDDRCAKIGTIIAEAKASIEEYKELKQAVIYDAVTKGLDKNAEMKDSGIEWVGQIPITWISARFSKVNWIRARLGWKGLKAEEYIDEGYPFLSAFNIQNYKLVWENINHITLERYDESPEIKLHTEDILLVKDGAGIGKCARVDNLPLGEATVNSSLAVITPKDSINYRYEYYYLLSPIFQNVITRLRNGMGVPHLTQEAMKEIVIPCPSIEEQINIADYLDKMTIEFDSLISEKQSLIEELEFYKKSLIYEVVTGKRKVVD